MRNDFARRQPSGGAESLTVETVWKVDADDSYDVSTHPSKDNLIIVVRTVAGVGRLTFRPGREVDLTAGTLCAFRYGDITRYRCAMRRWFFWWWECTTPDASGLPLGEVSRLAVSQTEVDELENGFRLMQSARRTAAAMGSLLMQSRVGRYLHDTAPEAPARTPQAAVEQAIGFMQNNLGGVDMGSLAAKGFLGGRRFRQVFKQVTGKPPKQYYDGLRLEHAGQLLLNTTLSVRQVADRLGYSSQFHFSRAFKKKFGVAPARWRVGRDR
jgi:AraC-like DNA-binding protein